MGDLADQKIGGDFSVQFRWKWLRFLSLCNLYSFLCLTYSLLWFQPTPIHGAASSWDHCTMVAFSNKPTYNGGSQIHFIILGSTFLIFCQSTCTSRILHAMASNLSQLEKYLWTKQLRFLQNKMQFTVQYHDQEKSGSRGSDSHKQRQIDREHHPYSGSADLQNKLWQSGTH